MEITKDEKKILAVLAIAFILSFFIPLKAQLIYRTFYVLGALVIFKTKKILSSDLNIYMIWLSLAAIFLIVTDKLFINISAQIATYLFAAILLFIFFRRENAR